MRSRTAAAYGAIVGATLGIGGTLFAQSFTDARTPTTFDGTSIERATANGLAAKVRDVSCEQVRGPFYTCTAYTGPDAGGSYEVTVDRNGRCLHATRTEPSGQDRIDAALRGFRVDTTLPGEYTAWLRDSADCR